MAATAPVFVPEVELAPEESASRSAGSPTPRRRLSVMLPPPSALGQLTRQQTSNLGAALSASGRQLSAAGHAGGKRVGSFLRRAASTLATPPRQYSHASLNEHMLTLSLTRSIKNKNWRAVARISFGWAANLLTFFGLLFTFALYACELFGSGSSATDASAAALLVSWAFSIFQRFVINEPMLILLSKGVPMLFTSELCANVCGETVVNLLDLAVQAVMACIKSIKTG